MRQFDNIKKLLRQDAGIEKLMEEIKSLEGQFTYGLVWDEEHPENYEDFDKSKSSGQYPILESEKGDIPAQPQRPTHILIQGDNYHALSVFQYTHRENQQVDLIFIDPPYNTGEQFLYNDKIVNEDDPYRHTKWLSFMKKRLLRAKDLLTDTGVIMICINDKEVAQLKILLDTHIFKEGCWQGTLTWINRTKPINSGKAKYGIQQNVEYILVYSKTPKSNHPGFLLPKGEKREYPTVYKGRTCRTDAIEDSDFGRKARDTMKFPILGVYPKKGKRWKIGQTTANDLIKSNRLALFDGAPKQIIYPEDEPGNSGYVPVPFYSHLINTGTAEDGKRTLDLLIGKGHGFDTVKPVDLIVQLLEFFPKNIRVLDFFAGSGTTLQAVEQANTTDKGTRQCILVTNNDGGIYEKVCKPRIKAVLKNSTTGDGLKLYRTGFISKKISNDQLKREMAKICHEMACLREGVFASNLTKKADKEGGPDGKWHYSWDEEKVCATFFRPHESEALLTLKTELDSLTRNGKRKGIVYAFSYKTDEVDPHTVKLLKGYTCIAIPDQILHLYKKCYPEIWKQEE